MAKEVIINGRFLTQRITGVQRFAYEICKELIHQGVEITIVAPPYISTDYKLDCKIITYGILRGPLWEQFDLFFYLLTNGKPLLLNLCGLGPCLYSNQILTIHDVSVLRHPEWFSGLYRFYYSLLTKTAHTALKIITISHFSKNEILELIKVPSEKIAVIQIASAFGANEKKMALNPARKKYILGVASLDPRKNLQRLIKAYDMSGLKDEYELILAGKGDPIFRMDNAQKIMERSSGYLSDEELLDLYQHASLFVYPSLYEGFGLPPLEAMSQGCPVILSDIPVFREIFGDAACFVDPNDVSRIVDGIIRVISDDTYRAELIRKGFERAAHYSWGKAAGLLMKQIEEL